jgi:tetratricopeptide (TPR) repeat protein
LQEAQGAGWATLLHPDDAAHHLESWQKSVATGIPFETEARFRRPDGEYRWFLTRANPLRDRTGRIVKWYGTNIDIENLKRTERRLRQSEANLAEAQRLSHTLKGDRDAAIAEYQKAREFNDDSLVQPLLAQAMAKSGNTAKARRILQQLKEMSARRYVAAYGIGLAHLGLGEKEEALRWLEKSYEDHAGTEIG